MLLVIHAGHASTQANAGSRSAVVRRWGGSGGLNGAGIVVQGGAEVTGMSRLAPLAVLGVGQTFGEELLGTDPSAAGPEDEDEFQVSVSIGNTTWAVPATG